MAIPVYPLHNISSEKLCPNLDGKHSKDQQKDWGAIHKLGEGDDVPNVPKIIKLPYSQSTISASCGPSLLGAAP